MDCLIVLGILYDDALIRVRNGNYRKEVFKYMMISNIVTSLKGMVALCESDVKTKELEICRCRLMAMRQFLIASLKTYDRQGQDTDEQGE